MTYSKYLSVKNESYVLLIHTAFPKFSTSIGAGCSGGLGILLFLCVLLFFFIRFHKRFSYMSWVQMVLGGTVIMYLINIIRLTLHFLISIHTARNWGNAVALKVSSQLHEGLGWVLYFLGLYLFFSFMFGKKQLSQVTTREVENQNRRASGGTQPVFQ